MKKPLIGETPYLKESVVGKVPISKRSGLWLLNPVKRILSHRSRWHQATYAIKSRCEGLERGSLFPIMRGVFKFLRTSLTK